MRNIVNVVVLWILLAGLIFLRDYPWSTQKVASVVVLEASPPVLPRTPAPKGRFFMPEFEEFPELLEDYRMQWQLADERQTAIEADPTIVSMKLVRNPTTYSWQATCDPPKFPYPIALPKLRMPYAGK